MEGVKIYGLCLERLAYQTGLARQNAARGRRGRVLLESYNTGDIEDIIDILELYDIQARTSESLKEKLEELADTISELLREELAFDYTEEGCLGLYLALNSKSLSDKTGTGPRACI